MSCKLLLVLCLAIQCTAQERVLVPIYLTAQGLDAWATDRGFESGNWHERNPLVPSSRPQRIAYFAATAGLVISASWLLHKTHHSKLAQSVLISGIATESYASTSSIHGLSH